MARTMKVGATWPPLRGQANDEFGNPVDLSTALELTMMAIGPTHSITATVGNTTAIQPPMIDPDGVHKWNWQYMWVVGETDVAGIYHVYLKVVWTPTEIEFFPDDGYETLTIEGLT